MNSSEFAQSAIDFERFFEANHVRLFATLCLTTGNPADAEDLMQDAFLRMWERWDSVSAHPDPLGYVYRTAFNLSKNRVRSALRAARRSFMGAEPSDLLDGVVHREALFRALHQLTPRQREAVVLVELLDMSSEDVADVLGVRPGTVRALCSQARARLRSELGEIDE